MVNVTIYSSTMDPMGIDFLIVTCWFPTWLCWALHAVAASCSHSKAGRSRCLQVQGPAFPAHGMSQATSLHCVLPLSPSSVSSQPLLHEKTAERIPAVNNSSLVYPLSIRQNPINLCSIESFTFWIIYIYTYLFQRLPPAILVSHGHPKWERSMTQASRYTLVFFAFHSSFLWVCFCFCFCAWRIASISQARVSPSQEVPLDMINHISIIWSHPIRPPEPLLPLLLSFHSRRRWWQWRSRGTWWDFTSWPRIAVSFGPKVVLLWLFYGDSASNIKQ